ncbi:hypothetical protein B0H12DRAFT_183855 [Mycena haematopus]|nr:hypothetical protein B0H12DRAFT_183855 [Mycena haematopus]
MRLQKSPLDLVHRAAQDSNVFWITPGAPGKDVYRPGSTILAAWTSPQTIDSPSFQLCVVSSSSSETGACSPTVWPEVTESEGVYQAPVTVPDALWDGTFFLRMLDKSGGVLSSPTFFLHPVGDSAVADSEPQAQAPLAPATPPGASVSPFASPPYSSSVSASLSTPPSLSSPSSQVPPAVNVLSAKSTPPPAAYAVPLSVVAAIILVAGVFYLKQRWRRGSQRRKESPSRTNSCKSSSSGRSEVGYALRVLSRHYGDAASPPPKTRKLRPPPLDALPLPAYAQWGLPPSPSNGVAYRRDSPMATQHDDPPGPSAPVEQPSHLERPRLPPIATMGSFMSRRSDPATHAVLCNYLLPSPPLSSSTSTPRCLLPAPQQFYLRDQGIYNMDNPLGSPPANRDRSEQELYARVANRLSMYRPRQSRR